MGNVSGDKDLSWSPGELSTRGVEGRPVHVAVKQRFVCENPLDLERITLDCTAFAGLGGHNELAVSLDGVTSLASASTEGRETGDNKRFAGALVLELSDVPQTHAVSAFWVHLVLANTAGRATTESNTLTRLRIEARAAAP